MRVRVLLQITGDDGTAGAAEEVAAFDKVTERLEDLGLSTAEGKVLPAAVQHGTAKVQAAAWSRRHRPCPACGGKRRCKGGIRITTARATRSRSMRWKGLRFERPDKTITG